MGNVAKDRQVWLAPAFKMMKQIRDDRKKKGRYLFQVIRKRRLFNCVFNNVLRRIRKILHVSWSMERLRFIKYIFFTCWNIWPTFHHTKLWLLSSVPLPYYHTVSFYCAVTNNPKLSVLKWHIFIAL